MGWDGNEERGRKEMGWDGKGRNSKGKERENEMK